MFDGGWWRWGWSVVWVVEERETRGIERGCCESVDGERSCCYCIFPRWGEGSSARDHQIRKKRSMKLKKRRSTNVFGTVDFGVQREWSENKHFRCIYSIYVAYLVLYLLPDPYSMCRTHAVGRERSQKPERRLLFSTV